MKRKGFAAVVIILIVVIVLAIAGGFWYYEAHQSRNLTTEVKNVLLAQGLITSDSYVIYNLQAPGIEGNMGGVYVGISTSSGTMFESIVVFKNGNSYSAENTGAGTSAPCVYSRITTEQAAIAAVEAKYPAEEGKITTMFPDAQPTKEVNGMAPLPDACYWTGSVDEAGGATLFIVNDAGQVWMDGNVAV